MSNEETNTQKLFRLLPELIRMDELIGKARDEYAKKENAIARKHKVKIECDEGVLIVSVGKNSGAFDYCDPGNDDVEEMANKGIENRIRSAGKEVVKLSDKHREKFYEIIKNLGWNVTAEEEFQCIISKDGLEIDIGGVDNFAKFRVMSPIEGIEVGYVARFVLENMAKKQKKKEAK